MARHRPSSTFYACVTWESWTTEQLEEKTNPNTWHILPADSLSPRVFVSTFTILMAQQSRSFIHHCFIFYPWHPRSFHTGTRAQATKGKGLWPHPYITNSRGCPCFPCHTSGNGALLQGCQTMARESDFWSHLESALFLPCSSQNFTTCPSFPNA